jgi:hypothetical protein
VPSAGCSGVWFAYDHGAVWATGVSSVLFGVWHVLPALDLARTNTVLRADTGNGRRRILLTVLGTVALTTVAGIVFAELRRASGSLLPPAGLRGPRLGPRLGDQSYVIPDGDGTPPGRSYPI